MKDTRRSRLLKRLSSVWIFSGIRLTLFSLVVLPSLVVFSSVFTQNMISRVNEVLFLKYPDELLTLLFATAILQWFVVFFILFIFPPYPFPISIKQYFKKRGYENAVVEYEISKKVLYVAVPALIIFIALTYPNVEAAIMNYGINLTVVGKDPNFKNILNYLVLVVFAAALKVMCVLLRRDFRLYYAKGCFKKIILQNNLNEVDIMNYVKKGLVAYNLYLRRNLNLQIKPLEEVVYKISVANLKERNMMIREISIAFNKDDKQTMEYFHQMQIFLQNNKSELENLTFTPLRKLYDYLQPLKPSEFLIEQSLIDRIKDKIALVATIPPLVIAIIQMSATIYQPLK
jgi:hypothetical protein